MKTFAVHADCAVAVPPTVDQQVQLAEALPDRDACVWTEDGPPGLVSASFDLTATGFEDAVETAKTTIVEALACAGLAGTLVAVTAMTEGGQARWTPDEAGVAKGLWRPTV